MLRRSFLVGLALGFAAGILSLATGALIVVLVAPAFLWGSRERGGPIGCGGLLVGAGAGMIGVLLAAQAGCRSDPTCSSSTPLEGFLLLGAGLVGLGMIVVVLGMLRHGRRHR